MSTKRLEELQKKYGTRTATLQKIYDYDTTPTKKYLEYMVKLWSGNKGYNGLNATTLANFATMVKRFDEVLPYIEDKDIYSPKYVKYNDLKRIVEDAEFVKKEKTFVKEDHVIIIHDCEKYTMLYPKTHMASVKYGATTRWCTAAKSYKGTFESYQSKGYLVYILDKTKKRGRGYEKLAFYMSKESGFMNGYSVYNVLDKTVKESILISSGWNYDELIDMDIRFRSFVMSRQRIEKSKKYIQTTLETIKTLDMKQLYNELMFMKEYKEDSYFENAQKQIDKFLAEIQEFQK